MRNEDRKRTVLCGTVSADWSFSLKMCIPDKSLAADAKLFDQFQIGFAIPRGDVTQQTAALANHLQQAATGHVIVLIGLEMLGQLFDTLGQHRDLGTRTARVFTVCLRALDSCRFLLTRDHVQTF